MGENKPKNRTLRNMALIGGGSVGLLAGAGAFVAGAVTSDPAVMATGGAIATAGAGVSVTGGIKQVKNVMSGGALEDMGHRMEHRPEDHKTPPPPPRRNKPGGGIDL